MADESRTGATQAPESETPRTSDQESGVYLMGLHIGLTSPPVALPFFRLTGAPGTPEEAFDTIEVQTPSVSGTGDFAENRQKLILSRKAADILEKLEPWVHGFRPLEIEMKSTRYRQRFEDKQYQLVDVKIALDIVDIGKSDVYADTITPPPPHPSITHYYLAPPSGGGKGRYRIFVKATNAAGHHLWRGGNRVLTSRYFVSKELKDAWESAGCGPMAYLACLKA